MPTFNIQARYVNAVDAEVIVSKYADGSTAVIATSHDESGYPNTETLSVNLSAYGLRPPTDEHIYVPDYSEHEGLPKALEEAGIAVAVEPGEYVRFGYGQGVLMRLNETVFRS